LTVIAWDGKTLAVDSLGVYSDRPIDIKKSMKTESGEILSGSGSAETVLVLFDWYIETGADPEKYPEIEKQDLSNLVVVSEAEIRVYYGKFPIVLDRNKNHAWGSGTDLALAAMHCGRNAIEACQVACELSVYCGGEIISYEVGRPAVPNNRKMSHTGMY